MRPEPDEYARWFAVGISAFTAAWLSSSIGWGVAVALTGWILLNWVDYAELARLSKAPLSRPAARSVFWQTPLERLFRTIRASRARSRSLALQLRRFTTTADSLPDAWVIVRGAGEIEAFNAAAKTLLGLNPSDRGQNLVALIRDPALVGLMNSADGSLAEIGSPRDETMRLEIRRIPIADRTIVIARDVTELNRLLSMRQDFIANVSHELRTPLTVIIGYLESLSDPTLDPETMSDLLRRLDPPAQRMRSLVEDLLTLTRLESAPMPNADTIESVDGAKLLTTIVAEARQVSGGAHEITLDAEPRLAIEGAQSEIHSAFANLISNAIRYSPDGGQISIRWFRTEAGARFEVEDRGVGIATEHLSRITERFYRVDLAGARVRGGTGLGLAIVKHVLRRHRSRLQVDSDLGKGSTFSCVFPLHHKLEDF